MLKPPWAPGEKSREIKETLAGARGIWEPVAPRMDAAVLAARRAGGGPPPAPPANLDGSVKVEVVA